VGDWTQDEGVAALSSCGAMSPTPGLRHRRVLPTRGIKAPSPTHTAHAWNCVTIFSAAGGGVGGGGGTRRGAVLVITRSFASFGVGRRVWDGERPLRPTASAIIWVDMIGVRARGDPAGDWRHELRSAGSNSGCH